MCSNTARDWKSAVKRHSKKKKNDKKRQLKNVKYLDAVVAGCDATILNFHVGSWVGKLAVGVRSAALVPLIFPAHLQLQPSGIFAVQQIVHVDHGHRVYRVYRVRALKEEWKM